MSLLMDALRKAEQQKQKIASEGKSLGLEGTAGKLELEPMPSQPGQQGARPNGETALPSLAGIDYTPTGGAAAPPPAAPPPGAFGRAGGGGLPKLPSRLEELDEQFLAHAAEARAAVSAATRSAPPLAQTLHSAVKNAPGATPVASGTVTLQRNQNAASREPTMVPAAPAMPSREPSLAALEPSPASNAEVARDAARNLFDAKQPATKGKGNRRFAITVGLLTLIAASGIGAYFWWQMQPKGGALIGGAGQSPPPSAAPLVAPPPSSSPTAGVATTQQPASPTTAVPSSPTFPTATLLVDKGGVVQKAGSGQDSEDGDSLPPTKREAAKSSPSATSITPAGARPQDSVRVTAATQKLNPLLEQAYDAFNRGEIEVAQAAWQKMLKTDPKNTDALQGLAAVAQQRQQPERAADLYLRALEADPKNALALSGLISLRGHADPQQTESRFKALLAEQPDSPFLNFALGNLYANGLRWADAQQAYFRAHVVDPGNPDYLFNLAVSLDQLHQPRLAAQYYNQAVGAAAQRPAGFDITEAAARLRVLQP